MLAQAGSGVRWTVVTGWFSLKAGGGQTTVGELSEALHATLGGGSSVKVAGIRHDSRRIEPGELFVARAGEHADGLQFVDQAVSRGAAAVMAERGHAPSTAPVPLLLVDDIRLALARAAAVIYGHPSKDLAVVGITGTNGKTTTACLVHWVLEQLGHQPGSMGTLGARFGGVRMQMVHNTPEADEVTRILAWLRDHQASHLVMEVTSHALAQRRTDGVHYRVAALTNLTVDHLDLHADFEAYGQAKARLLLDLEPEIAAVVIDHEFGRALAERRRGPRLQVSRFADARAEVRPLEEPHCDRRGIRCEVATPAGPVHLESPLIGTHNLENLLLALGIVVGLDLNVQRAAQALGSCPEVPGRLQRCDEPTDDIAVFVDYAHSPDALDKALAAVRPFTTGRLICVFGCGGNRDASKRPLMGEVVGRGADVAIVTNDNPRDEDPETIAAAILQGLAGQGAEPLLQLDRALAIHRAVARAAPGDAVLIAGKGHERTQTIAGVQRPFDDPVHARQALVARRGRGA